MKQASWRWLTDNSMIVVLLTLCVAFSALTYREQPPTGAAAGGRLAAEIISRFGNSARVLIVVRDLSEDRAFAEQMRQDLAASGAQVVDVVRGEPKDARAALQRIIAAGGKLDVVAATQEAGAWYLFVDLKTDFPLLGETDVVVPDSYLWPTFLMPNNLLNIANQIAIIAIIAIGMTMVIITGGIDLSVGSLIALSAVVAAKLIRDVAGGMEASPAAMILCCIAAIVLCGFVGAFAGTMIMRFDVPPFIVTLSMMLVASGLAHDITKEQTINEIPNSFVWLGRRADVFGLPNAVVLMLVLYILAHILMSRMRLGRYLYAVGGNREAARLSGVPVTRVVLFAYVASAVLAGLGGVVMASQLKSGSPNYGDMYELFVIAAAVVGGTSLSGGEGKMFRTLAGAFTIAVMQNGMNLMNIESQTQKVVLGLVILGAVLIDKVQSRA